jgi:hypothetical protein
LVALATIQLHTPIFVRLLNLSRCIDKVFRPQPHRLPFCFGHFVVSGFQVGSGLISDDEISNAGPLTHLVSEKTIQWAAYWHTEIGKAVISGFDRAACTCHCLVLSRRTRNLVRPMLTGDKESQEQAPSSFDRPIDWIKAILALAISAYLIYRLINLRALNLSLFCPSTIQAKLAF